LNRRTTKTPGLPDKGRLTVIQKAAVRGRRFVNLAEKANVSSEYAAGKR
jgi:hypothetical protein